MQETPDKRKFVLKMALLYAVSLVMLVIIFSAFVKPAPKTIIREEIVSVPEKQPVADNRPLPDTAMIRELEQLQATITEKNSLITELKGNAAQVTTPAPVVDNSREVTRLKDEVAAKSAQVTRLQAELKTSRSASGAPASSATAKDLETRNANLVKGFNAMQTQMGMLQKNYNILKAENARLAQRLANAQP